MDEPDPSDGLFTRRDRGGPRIDQPDGAVRGHHAELLAELDPQRPRLIPYGRLNVLAIICEASSLLYAAANSAYVRPEPLL